MSFLGDILSAAQFTASSHNVEAKNLIKEEISSIQIDVKKYMEKVYLQKKPSSLNYDHFLKKISKCEDDIASLINSTVEDTKYQIIECTSESKTYQNEHKEALLTLKVVSALITIDELFQEIRNTNESTYDKTSEFLKQIDELLNDKELNLQSLDIYKSLKFTYRRLFSNFITEVEKSWCKNIKTSEQDTSTSKTVEIAINIDKCELIHKIIRLFIIHKYKTQIFAISKFFLNNILIPIIKFKTVLTLKQGQEKNEVLQIKIDKLDENPPIYTEVFANIHQAVDFLGYINICLSDNTCFYGEIASLIKKDFTECLIKDCLMRTIQSTLSITDTNFQEQIKEFQESLSVFGFYNEADIAILDFANNIDIHFANKECNKFLEKARDIMKKDLHDTIEINSNKSDNKHLEAVFCPLSFPKCKISQNILELQEIVIEILQKCNGSSSLLRERLLCTACNIVSLYEPIVVIHHKNNLKLIPQQSAIFHNNCMYLAHWLLTIQKQMQSYKITQDECRIMLYFDNITSLRLLGAKYLNEQLKIQKNIILTKLRDSDLNLISQVTKLNQTEVAVSACIEIINDLQRAWFEVLPDNVFSKCIALLYNVLIEELIQRVCNAEDIPATVAEDLVSYFENVQQSALKTFKRHDDIMPRVKLWQKFQEIKNVLKGNLESIESQWANGKGPLATVLERQEIKHLIRALFKNTDRRAELLIKIK